MQKNLETNKVWKANELLYQWSGTNPSYRAITDQWIDCLLASFYITSHLELSVWESSLYAKKSVYKRYVYRRLFNLLLWGIFRLLLFMY